MAVKITIALLLEILPFIWQLFIFAEYFEKTAYATAKPLFLQRKQKKVVNNTANHAEKAQRYGAETFLLWKQKKVVNYTANHAEKAQRYGAEIIFTDEGSKP